MMKLNPKLKVFYSKASQIPIVGAVVFGPVLKSVWKIAVWIDSKTNKNNKRNPQSEIQMATYSSVIYTMQQRIEHLEKRLQILQGEVEASHWKSDYRHKLDAAVFDGIYAALAKERSKSTDSK